LSKYSDDDEDENISANELKNKQIMVLIDKLKPMVVPNLSK